MGTEACDAAKSQKSLVRHIEQVARDELLSKAGQHDRARLLAARAPHAGAWLTVEPSRALDQLLANDVVRGRVGRRLGVQIGEEGPCPFCLQVNDGFGAHAEACMGGGDKVATHNTVRDVIHRQARAAGTRPELEKTVCCPLCSKGVSFLRLKTT